MNKRALHVCVHILVVLNATPVGAAMINCVEINKLLQDRRIFKESSVIGGYLKNHLLLRIIYFEGVYMKEFWRNICWEVQCHQERPPWIPSPPIISLFWCDIRINILVAKFKWAWFWAAKVHWGQIYCWCWIHYSLFHFNSNTLPNSAPLQTTSL